MRRHFVIAAALMLPALGCSTAPPQKNQPNPPIVTKPLPPPPTGELKYAGNPVPHPFTKQEGNHFARTAFETDGPGNSHIEVRDILIPPKAKSTVAPLPGSAVMDLSNGKVTLAIGDKREELSGGPMRALPGGQALEFENTESQPAAIRLFIIRAR
jgi:hypothetical protein